MELTLKVGLDGKPEKDLTIVAYAFDHAGELIASAPVNKQHVQLRSNDDRVPARILLGPALLDKRKEVPTIDALERLRAYEPVWRYTPKQTEYDLLPIPELNWKWWWLCACRVRGRAVKPVNINGVIQDMPICHARVHICEVDPLWLIIPRLPDTIIDRIREELLQPQPPVRIPIPIPDPPPFKLDPTIIDVSPRNLARMQAPQLKPMVAAVSSHADHLHVGDEVMLNPQPLPPKQIIELPATLRTQLLSDSPKLTRQALLDHAALLRPYFCWWPWIWPYFYRCDEVAVRDTDHNGYFDATIHYPCFGDHPDLYFWVEYSIGGVWTTVYHPPMHCNTWWDYACGTEVVIRVSDPRVPWCGDPNPLPGKQVAVLLVGNGVSMTEIQRAGTGINEGLTTDGEPFGGSLEPHVWFGDGLITSGIDHYRWSYRRLLNPPSGDWHAMDKEVVRHYGEIMADSTLTFKPYPLGPDPAFAGQNLFKIRPVTPPLNAGAVSSSWAPEIDARTNTASAFFLSHLLNGGNAATAAGKYELKLELFKSSGTPVNLSDEGVLLKVPTIDGPFGSNTVPTDLVAHFPAHLGDMEDRVIRDGSGKIVAFRLVLHVDNTQCAADIYPVNVNGNSADICGFVQYQPGDDVHVSYRAAHPNNFATFDFSIARGSSGVVETANGGVGDNPVDGYARTSSSIFSKDVPVEDLLGTCPKAAFAENLHVRALATDGWSKLSYLDAHATPVAFALEPTPPTS